MSERSATSDDSKELRSTTPAAKTDPTQKLHWGALSIAGAGGTFVIYGVVFLYRAFYGNGFELGVHAPGGTTKSELAANNPELFSYVTHLHVNIAALMIPLGIAMIALAWYGVRRGQWWAVVTSTILPVIFLAISLPMHFTGEFSYHALTHMGPAGPGGLLLLVGAVLAYQGFESTDSHS